MRNLATDNVQRSIADGGRLLNIGPRYLRGKIQPGGIVVLFENWVEYCARMERNTNLVDNNKRNYPCRPLAVMSILWQALRKIPKSDVVMLHGTIHDYQWLAPAIVWMAKRKGKKIVLRKFAGNFGDYYDAQRGLKRKLLDYVLHASDVLMWETHCLVEKFSHEFPDKKSLWFTNVRNRMPLRRKAELPFRRRFVFLSRVERVKGLDYLISAFDQLGSDYRLDIYGPLTNYELRDSRGGNCSYEGVVPSERVNSVLVNYDVLILPTCWRAEGYPGIIMEAYNAGLPVIATKVGGIPELIEDGKNGYLIDPESVSAIVDAVKRMDTADYHRMSRLAYDSFNVYDAEHVNKNMMDQIL